MSIEKTLFTSSDKVNELYNWLRANATEYFSRINISSGSIACYKDNSSAINFASGTGTPTAYLANGTSLSAYGISGTYPDYVVKTENGIYLHNSGGHEVIVTKTDHDTLAFVFICLATSALGSARIRTADYSRDNYFTDWGLIVGTTTMDNMKEFMSHANTGLTALVPVVPGASDSYCPGLFVAAYTQYGRQEGIIELDGVKYWYNGCFALRE